MQDTGRACLDLKPQFGGEAHRTQHAHGILAQANLGVADDTLVLDNRDTVAHTLGNWVVPPNTIQAFELQPAYGGVFACSLHPSGAITMNIQPRDYDFALIAFPTFGFGIAVGIVIIIGLNVTRALKDQDEDTDWATVERTLASAKTRPPGDEPPSA